MVNLAPKKFFINLVRNFLSIGKFKSNHVNGTLSTYLIEEKFYRGFATWTENFSPGESRIFWVWDSPSIFKKKIQSSLNLSSSVLKGLAVWSWKSRCCCPTPPPSPAAGISRTRRQASSSTAPLRTAKENYRRKLSKNNTNLRATSLRVEEANMNCPGRNLKQCGGRRWWRRLFC